MQVVPFAKTWWVLPGELLAGCYLMARRPTFTPGSGEVAC